MKLKAFLFTMLFSISLGLFIYTSITLYLLKKEEGVNQDRFYRKNKEKIDNILEHIDIIENNHDLAISMLNSFYQHKINSKKDKISNEELKAITDKHINDIMRKTDAHLERTTSLLRELPTYKPKDEVLSDIRMKNIFLFILGSISLFSAYKSYNSFSVLNEDATTN